MIPPASYDNPAVILQEFKHSAYLVSSHVSDFAKIYNNLSFPKWEFPFFRTTIIYKEFRSHHQKQKYFSCDGCYSSLWEGFSSLYQIIASEDPERSDRACRPARRLLPPAPLPRRGVWGEGNGEQTCPHKEKPDECPAFLLCEDTQI